MGSWKGRGNQYFQFVRVLYCKLPTNGKQLPAFPLEAVPGTEPRPQRWEARVLQLWHHGPQITTQNLTSCQDTKWTFATTIHNQKYKTPFPLYLVTSAQKGMTYVLYLFFLICGVPVIQEVLEF